MSIRIAVPEPTSSDAAYNARSLPPYITALQSSGAIPVVIPLHEDQERVASLLAGSHGVLLPGSGFDVDPERYGETRIAECGPADSKRTAVDELLLQDAFNLRKPILAICHGLQTLNVWLNGSLIQDLETVTHSPVNHRPGRDISEAHPVRIQPGSRLASVLDQELSDIQVNSSHHQALNRLGDNLRITAISPRDNVVEAVELQSPGHFVVGVQWHPERTFAVNGFSRSLFEAFVDAAATWHSSALGSQATHI
jgi:putative glutamine amidotransferase